MIFAIAAALGYMGIRRGFIGEVFRFAAMVAGFFAAFLYYGDLQASMGWLSSNQPFRGAVAFLFIFIAVYLAVVGIGLLLKKFTQMMMLGWFDGALGLTLGLLKASLITWAACLSISSFPFQKVQDEFGTSVVYKTFNALPGSLSLSGMERMKDAIRGKDREKSESRDSDAIDDIIGGEQSGDKKPAGKKGKPKKKDKAKPSAPAGKAAETDV
jgi:uncharacterized membrane protein required for colicin V production